MHRKENAEQVGKRKLGRIELYLRDLGMPGRLRADLFVRRILRMPAGIARHDIFNTLQIVKNRLNAPKTSRTQRCCL
jgi:hypothetical protein